MTTPRTTPVPADLAARLSKEEDRIRTELARSETKAGLLLTASGMILSAVVAGAALGHVPPAVATVGLLAGTAAALVLVLAVLVVLPRLGSGRHGWPRFAGADAQAVLDELAAADEHRDQAQQVGYLARLAVTKHRLAGAACWLMVAAALLLLVAGVLAVLVT